MTRMAGQAADVDQAIALAERYLAQDPRQLAAGDPSSEFMARLLPAAMVSGVDPGKAMDAYLGPRNAAFVASQPYEREMAMPGNYWVYPDQETQHRTGNRAELDWQYPFTRQDLVKAGLLPSKPPSSRKDPVPLPPGMSVLQAIQAGVIR